MKTCFIVLLFVFSAHNGWTQLAHKPLITRHISLNPNDTTFTRIFDGVIIGNEFHVKDGYNSIRKIVAKDDIAALGLNSVKPVMVIESERGEIETEIYKHLYKQPNFLSYYQALPDIFALPISLNGKLLDSDNKKAALGKLNTSLLQISFLNGRESMAKFGVAPFGVISLDIRGGN